MTEQTQNVTVQPFRAGLAQETSASSFARRSLGALTGPPNPPGGPYTLLADVSEFQADVADAAYLAWSKSIIYRIAYGTRTDKAWYNGARRAALHAGGVIFGGMYQYIVAGEDPVAQAEAAVGLIGHFLPGEALFADVEEGGGSQSARYKAWAATIERALGYDPPDYSGLAFAHDHGLEPVNWLADYTTVEPSVPHELWQFTDHFAIPGVGVADCSIYHGTSAELAAQIGWRQPATTITKPAAPAAVKEDTMPFGELTPGTRHTASWLAGTVGQVVLKCDWKDKLPAAPKVALRIFHNTGNVFDDVGTLTVDEAVVYPIEHTADAGGASFEVAPYTSPAGETVPVTVGWHTNPA